MSQLWAQQEKIEGLTYQKMASLVFFQYSIKLILNLLNFLKKSAGFFIWKISGFIERLNLCWKKLSQALATATELSVIEAI